MAATTRGKRWATAPDPNETGWPKGVPYIIGNEGCERFSFYGMKSILAIYLASLYALEGATGPEAKAHATEIVHLFIVGVYAIPMLGAILADRLLGKYNTIFWLSLIYCAGHGVLALFETSTTGIYAGLALIAIGSGGIKPCVSANVGDQFGKGNWNKVTKVYQAFYFIINFGSFFSTLLIPWVKEAYGPSLAFGIPGILMGIATIFFWAGRNTYVHVPPKPAGKLGLLDTVSGSLLFLGTFGLLFVPFDILPVLPVLGGAAGLVVLGFIVFSIRQKDTPDDGFLAVTFYQLKVRFGGSEDKPLASASGDDPSHPLLSSAFWSAASRRFGVDIVEGPIAVLRIISVFIFVSMFWALFDQHSSTWLFQAELMDLHFNLPILGEFDILPAQTAALNPVLVMLLIPITGFIIYPAIEAIGFKLTPLRRMTLGMFMAAVAYLTVAWIQGSIDDLAAAGNGEKMHVAWQGIPYILMTLSEVMVSITGLEFAYTQAPKRMKSTIMGFWLITVALGNKLVAVLAGFKGLDSYNFFLTFAGLMAGFALLFALRASFYKYRDFSQDT